MNRDQTLEKTKKATHCHEADDELMYVWIIRIMNCTAGLIAIWSISCLVSGLTECGSVIELGANWVSAAFG